MNSTGHTKSQSSEFFLTRPISFLFCLTIHERQSFHFQLSRHTNIERRQFPPTQPTMAAQTRPIALALLLFGLSRQQVDALEEAVISPVAGLDSLEAPMIPIHQLSRLRGSTQDNNIRVLQGNSQTTQGYSASERAFANQCVSELLSDSVLFDGIISQKEFAGGMNKFCQLFTASAMALDPAFACPNDEFYSLPTGVQLLFSEVICGKEDTMQTRMKCLDDLRDLNSMGYDYGYIVTDEKMADVQMGVDNMCINLMPFVFSKYIGMMSSCSHVMNIVVDVRRCATHNFLFASQIHSCRWTWCVEWCASL